MECILFMGVSRFFILVCLLVMLCLTDCSIERNKGVVQVLSEDEIIMLESMYNNKERIKLGQLFDYQLDNLERYRFAKEYMSEKYSDYIYEFIGGEPKSKMNSYAQFYVENELCDIYTVYVKDGYVAEDNFYASFFEEQYEAYIFDYLNDKIDGVIEVSSKMPFTKGVEYGINMQMTDIVSGDLDLTANSVIHIIGSFDSDIVDIIKNMSKECNLYGSYVVYFYSSEEDYRNVNYTDKETFQYFKK